MATRRETEREAYERLHAKYGNKSRRRAPAVEEDDDEEDEEDEDDPPVPFGSRFFRGKGARG